MSQPKHLKPEEFSIDRRKAIEEIAERKREMEQTSLKEFKLIKR